MAVPHYRGSSTHVYELARHLAMLGHEVHIVARRVSSKQKRDEFRDGIGITRLHRGIVFSSPKSSFANTNSAGSYRGSTPNSVWKIYELYLMRVFPLYAGIEIANLVREKKLDVILERESSFGAGVIASRLTGRPYVLEVIGNRVTQSQLQRARKIITYTPSMFRNLVDEKKIESITAAVDVDLFKPDIKSAKEIREKYALYDKPVVGYVGTFQEWHGMEELLRASVILLGKLPGAKFLMVGPYFRGFQQKVERAGLSTSFIFTGPVQYEDVPKYMGASDVLVAPYNPGKIESSEQVRKHGIGSPLKVFEYMAMCKPVITTSVKPITDIIVDHETGILIPPGDSQALAYSMSELIQNSGVAKEIGENARQVVIARYSWDGVAIRITEILQSSINPGFNRRNVYLAGSRVLP